jgi:thiamine biosynthesis protein ThiS
VNVVVNSRVVEVPVGSTVAELLEQLGVPGPYALVERNGEPIDRAAYDELRLADGDALVVARPVAGG